MMVAWTLVLSGSPVAAAFPLSSCYGNRALVVPAPFGQGTKKEQYHAPAAGGGYCFASLSSRTDSFDPDMFLAMDATEGDFVVPARCLPTDGISFPSGIWSLPSGPAHTEGIRLCREGN
jgi:hypothetical protein